MTCLHLHRYDDAEPLLVRWLAAHPGDQMARYRLALARCQISMVQIARLLAVAPDSYHVHQLLGQLYVSLTMANEGSDGLQEDDKAIAEYSRALEINPVYHMAYYNRGVAYDNTGQWDKAIADYSRAIEIDPNFTKAYYNRGITYGHLGQWNKAITDFSAVITIDPNNAKAYSYREMAIRKLQEMKK